MDMNKFDFNEILDTNEDQEFDNESQKQWETIKKHMRLLLRDGHIFATKGQKEAAKRARKQTSVLTKLFKDFRKVTVEETR